MTKLPLDEVEALADKIAGCTRPTLIPRPFSAPILDDPGLLAVLQKWASLAASGQVAVDHLIEKLDARAMPGADAETLEACIEQLEERWRPDRDWYAYLTNVQQLDGDLWERVIDVLTPVMERAGGLPPGGVRLELFFGRYQSTPTGIHLDTSDNVAFVLHGPKRMMFWPRDSFESLRVSPDGGHEQALTARYQDHADTATILEAKAGDVLVWQKEYWHIAVGPSPAAWTAMLTVPLWWSASRRRSARFLIDSLPPLPPEADPARAFPGSMDRLADIAREVPPDLAAACRELAGHVEETLELTTRLIWAYFATSYGFLVPPEEASVPPISLRSRVRVKHPIAVLEVLGANVAVSCGRLVPIATEAAARSLRAMSVGSMRTIEEWLSVGQAPAKDHDAFLSLVHALLRHRALELL